jgi:hypothetical protein
MYKSSGPAYLLPKDFTDNSYVDALTVLSRVTNAQSLLQCDGLRGSTWSPFCPLRQCG